MFLTALKYILINSFETAALNLQSESFFRGTYYEILNAFITISTMDVDNMDNQCVCQLIDGDMIPPILNTMISLAQSISEQNINTLFNQMKTHFPE
ncbi:unnamed protein product [Adineta steineri]|uniref:Uncharacterized protein n=1 Tax=Adineta steineri TaxID=433720 RepID=A0A818J297_9BILA|nr:unnamed protein product [Adineta steineri]CAF3705002.1 unnamed protein product [Adineta steineri]